MVKARLKTGIALNLEIRCEDKNGEGPGRGGDNRGKLMHAVPYKPHFDVSLLFSAIRIDDHLREIPRRQELVSSLVSEYEASVTPAIL